jgi:hypothetical protein
MTESPLEAEACFMIYLCALHWIVIATAGLLRNGWLADQGWCGSEREEQRRIHALWQVYRWQDEDVAQGACNVFSLVASVKCLFSGRELCLFFRVDGRNVFFREEGALALSTQHMYTSTQICITTYIHVTGGRWQVYTRMVEPSLMHRKKSKTETLCHRMPRIRVCCARVHPDGKS